MLCDVIISFDRALSRAMGPIPLYVTHSKIDILHINNDDIIRLFLSVYWSSASRL